MMTIYSVQALYHEVHWRLTPVFESIDMTCQSRLRATREFETDAVSQGQNFAFAFLCSFVREVTELDFSYDMFEVF